ncbi:MAG: DNA mismatch repair protein MutS [Lachnospiraceae bacterium]|nr:DNA mismatch repair protein MutS [Lachnospiraceae bacterium]
MMQKYMETKQEYTDCILFYRLGDFYEMFFEDAKTVSRELDLTLTGKSCGLVERAPMCGVPYHSCESYINRLVKKGYKVAICEQVEDPRKAKGLVKREVIRVVTPGTNMDDDSGETGKNSFLLCVYDGGDSLGISAADVSTGDYYLTEEKDRSKIFDEINKYAPPELVLSESFLNSGFDIDLLRQRWGTSVTALPDTAFDPEGSRKLLMKHFKVNSLTGLGLDRFPNGTTAAGVLLKYLYDTQKRDMEYFTRIYPYSPGTYMLLDQSTERNLELIETMRDKTKKGSLLGVLDRTKTAMGGRLLRRVIEQPLVDADEIRIRQLKVKAFNENTLARDEIREYLSGILDLERLSARASYGTANPRDLISLRDSLSVLPAVKTVLQDVDSEPIKQMLDSFDDLSDLCSLIDSAIKDEPPILVHEGGIIKDGYDSAVDEYRAAGTDGRKWLMDLEESEKEKTGIKNLKIRYNSVFGYYIEVSNSFKDKVPQDYVRKQTLVGSERYINEPLKQLEDKILGAEEKMCDREYELFSNIRKAVSDETLRIQRAAEMLAKLDVMTDLSYVGEKNNYVMPDITDDGVIDIKDGRHPVVEQMTGQEMFIPNDTLLDNKKHCVAVITGPNMAGKSTYMRQTALIVLMAQIGSPVPAKHAKIGLVDRIFTRVGASDDLSTGRSTFMVEMSEVANILRNATSKSLLILDEIGRGTSTYDGLSIAWAVVEHISSKRILGARTLFATHYHELTELEGKIDNVNNYRVAVREKGDDIIFLRKIMKGSADRSYGIQVAKLAGVPDMVTDRAKELLSRLADNDITEKLEDIGSVNGDMKAGKAERKKNAEAIPGQMTFFDAATDSDIVKELTDIDITSLTPMDAMNTLYRLQNEALNRFKA